MKQTFKGWTVGLVDSNGRKYFLGVYKTAEGTWCGTVHDTLLEKNVYSGLFESKEEALEFWKTCYWEHLESKSSLTSIPVKIEISIDVAALGFDWSGAQKDEMT
jgi:hypothetical protein